MKKNKFNFYDVVKISSNKNSLKEIDNSLGVIRGMSQNEETGEWGYAVSVYKDNDLIWDILEEDLVFTGDRVDPSDFKDKNTIKVQVDPSTGSGKIIDR